MFPSILTILLAVAQAQSSAQPAELMPGARYNARIPTIESVLGHGFGARISTPEQIAQYLQAVHRAAPDRTRLIEYARSWEGRPLHVLVIGAPGRLANLDAIKQGLRRLADPRGLSPSEAEQLVTQLPVVTWLMHAVHGNEISSSDAALAEAYHLLAAEGDPKVDLTLRESVVLIDPLENPDGRARFVLQNLLAEAALADSEPEAAEHDEPWPGGRANHYLFDMNRDWFAQSQPETRGRTRLFLDWYPHVVVDLHEMGGNSTYYFAPPADPLNPYITKTQTTWFDTFGRANAQRFDARGFSYFIREMYDSFYPGYGESWPIFHGAIGMTYEQASARGLRFRREDGTILSYRDGVIQHFTAAIATAHTAASHRERLLRDFLEFRRTAVKEGEQGSVREYLLPPGRDPGRTTRLARLLVAQGFDVLRAEEPLRVAGNTLPTGTYIVPVAQPAGRLLRNLMDTHVAQPEEFLKEQERRRRKRLGEQIYDVTAWSLPLAFDVEVVTSDRPSRVKATPVRDAALPWMLMPTSVQSPGVQTTEGDGNKPNGGDTRVEGPGLGGQTAGAGGTPASAARLPPAQVGYLAPWGSATAAATMDALREGLRVRTADLPFALAGRLYPAGTLFVRASENGPDLQSRLGAVAARHGAEVVPIDTAFVDSGISLGSSQVTPLQAPRVLMAWDTPTSSLSAGWARYVLERRFGQAVTIVRTETLGRVSLERFDVLILPSGTYTSVSGDLLRRLKDWINGGGTLVTLAEASRWAARESVGLLSTTTELRGGKPDPDPSTEGQRRDGQSAPQSAPQSATDQKKTDTPPAQPIDLEKAIEPERERPDSLPGAMLRVQLDPEHWLSAGSDGEIQAMIEGSRIFTPIRLDKGRNVGVYAKADALVASGFVWEDLKAQLAQKAFLVHQPHGRGHVIAFAEDPNFRAFMEATELLFVNAILLGPSH